MRKLIITTATLLSLAGGMGVYAMSDIPAEDAVYSIVYEDESTETEALQNNENKADTVSAIGSVSKVFCVTAAMQLSEQGKLELDAPVTDYVPDFRMEDERYKDITVRMLMNHTSGLMGQINGDMLVYDDVSMDYHDGFLDNLCRSRLKCDPGTMANYCNDGLTLLEIVVERVSGESFTDYVEENICKPLGLSNTGTSIKMYGSDNSSEIFVQGDVPYATDYCNAFGSGGIMSTADETRKFGTAFFTGDNTLLSETSKKEMMKTELTDKYQWNYGLGWDSVDLYSYVGVEDCPQVLFKGGALNHQFAGLMVAPDEEISVAVTISGGDSEDSIMLTQELMSAALEEKRYEISDDMPEDQKTLDEIPDEFLDYADIYARAGGIYRVDFADSADLSGTSDSAGTSYEMCMLVTDLTSDNPKPVYYKYTESGAFIRMQGEPGTDEFIPDTDQLLLYFSQGDENTYITSYENKDYDGFNRFRQYDYYLMRVGEKSVDEESQLSWQEREGKKYYLSNMKYSDTSYNLNPAVKVTIPDGVTGYILCGEKTAVIESDSKARGFTYMPGGGGRELEDYEIIMENGTEYLISSDNTLRLISEEAIPDFTSDITEIELNSNKTEWYNVGEIAGKTVTFDIPEKAAIYVYDKYDNVIYSSFMKGYGTEVTLPEEGKIAFIGETGGVIQVQK